MKQQHKKTILTILILILASISCKIESITPTPQIPTNIPATITSYPTIRPSELPPTKQITSNNKYIVSAYPNGLNLREFANDNSRIFMTIPDKETVIVLFFRDDNWACVEYNNIVGYVYGDYLKLVVENP